MLDLGRTYSLVMTHALSIQIARRVVERARDSRARAAAVRRYAALTAAQSEGER